MKELIDVRDFLIGIEIVGDWDGEEEEVTERINSLIFQAYNLLPEDISFEAATELFDELWAAVAGQDFVIENEIDELESWLADFVGQTLDEIEYD
ncbi:hypothetical protein KO525_03180 [Psychrosphaera sp. B3R10]|uniref:Uncharacterized protein n=1 Tax=Psychrosphaera algicola TaxID=3023714 RepID=A0ABT5F9A8_9GAMM|nr:MULTISPECIES: hypothetical protein [unclassified Psychrosphaera]MBU2881278.1 hypothetical protein [Psychrosphaera sp. I2R16]MBU2988377.1 hypothetical protein [Psychrosphaera sp. B3R10]MDC2888100.1 hypothetical protein [Psychrosphaera sp. G1-22]MDO6720123.1 hypothetical protein [Psychrosphaera sp. 1_MG-2023]